VRLRTKRILAIIGFALLITIINQPQKIWPLPVIFGLSFASMTGFVARKKEEKCLSLLDKLMRHDPLWEPAHMKERMETIFRMVMEAWTNRQLTAIESYASVRFIEEHQKEIEELVAQHRINKLERCLLSEIRIVHFTSHADTAQDTVTFFVLSSMLDYIVDDRSWTILSGSTTAPKLFAELWSFTRRSDQWVLDRIQHQVTLDELNDMIFYLEAPNLEI
jgi:predicted lipid-binding transport protein (Tim44 family)